MQRVTLVLLALVCGCSRPAPPVVPQVGDAPAVAAEAAPLVPPPPAPSADARYDAALGDAMARLAEGKLAEALAALEAARAAKDTELVRGEIGRLRQRLDQNTTAERTAEAIRVVLRQGRADEAARLATQALGQYGGGDGAETFTALKRQADALLATGEQADQLVREAAAAAADKNLRAALVAYEQALSVRPDDAVRRQADELRSALGRYDELCSKAAALRRDPARLEEALDAYRQAAGVWDTLQIRQEIDACTLALQNRRDRLAVADFEVRGGLGRPDAGRLVAEELTPAFRGRFDVVERQQLARLSAELKLATGDAAAGDAGTEMGRLAKARYLVVGSLTSSYGAVTANARLVEVATGLVVQTAQVVAPGLTELTRLLPQLALMLQMSDAERLTYEQSLARGRPVEVIEPPATLPPLTAAAPAAVIIPYTARPVEVGGLVFEDFARPRPDAAISLVIDKNHKAKPRLTYLAVELGDNLFRRGLMTEAKAQFRLALELNPGQADIAARLDRCGSGPPASRPRVTRLAVLDFVTPGNPVAVPPGLGPWVGGQLAPYYAPAYDVLERGQVAWYMGRLGLSLRDVVVDPAAMAYLGQALAVQAFITGTVRPTPAGLEVTAHLFDAASTARLDLATVMARNPDELKLRLPELARWMLTDPAERPARSREAEAFQKLAADADSCLQQQRFELAISHCRAALKVNPGDVRVQVLLAKAERQSRQTEFEAQRRAELDRAQALVAVYQQRQADLTRQADEARRQAEREAAAVAEAERERRRRVAAERLLAQARTARDQQRWAESRQLYESALGLDRSADAARELEQVKALVDEQARRRAAEDQAAREAARRKQQEAEVVALRAQVENDRRRREAEEAARLRNQQERDRTEYARLVANAKQLQANKRHDEAVQMLQAAQRLMPGPEATGLVNAAIAQRDQAVAETKRRADDEASAAAEAKRRADAEAQAVQAALAQKAAAEKANPLPPTPPPLPKDQPKAQTPPPLPKVQPKTPTPPPLPKDQPKAATPPPLPKDQPKAQTPPPLPKDQPKAVTPPPLPKAKPMPPEYMRKMDAGAAAEKQAKYADAQKAYQDALKVVPGDPAATKRVEYAKQMDAGTKALQARKFPDAITAFEAALKAAPKDEEATKALQRAKTGK